MRAPLLPIADGLTLRRTRSHTRRTDKIFINDVGVFLLLCAIIIVGFSLSFWLLLAGAIAQSDSPLETYGGATNQPFMMSLWGLLGNTYNTLRELDAPETFTQILVPSLYFAFLFLCIVGPHR